MEGCMRTSTQDLHSFKSSSKRVHEKQSSRTAAAVHGSRIQQLTSKELDGVTVQHFENSRSPSSSLEGAANHVCFLSGFPL
ncbi:hypothetical protein LR48_Vigan316s001300 [Vigna angularis]|uniref:Uncharacterized protein n=2 Tax=Phaseolus angularis TaxID=3914 RepID=A0A0L9T8R1_PHAAN|nr:hypothetical protein LR48_Vigan316s001300 [Vigna angularis]BAT88654.1 hypothetical protein VIGAN_05220200 [Vigna angularis var. angularis]